MGNNEKNKNIWKKIAGFFAAIVSVLAFIFLGRGRGTDAGGIRRATDDLDDAGKRVSEAGDRVEAEAKRATRISEELGDLAGRAEADSKLAARGRAILAAARKRSEDIARSRD